MAISPIKYLIKLLPFKKNNKDSLGCLRNLNPYFSLYSLHLYNILTINILLFFYIFKLNERICCYLLHIQILKASYVLLVRSYWNGLDEILLVISDHFIH